MKFTIFGGEGFIGSNLTEYLKGKGHDIFVPARNGSDAIGTELGNVIYTIGLTGDFKSRPFDTVEAHVCMLAPLLLHAKFDSWLYLSSTRLYGGCNEYDLANEDMPISTYPNLDSLYDISKLMGEALCLSQQSPKVRIARLSNVYGHGQSAHTFLATVLHELTNSGKVTIRESPETAKDYIALPDVLYLLEAIALYGQERMYNLASGIPITHAQLANHLIRLTGNTIQFAKDTPFRKFPRIDISRIVYEFEYLPRSLQEYLNELLDTAGTKKKDIIYEHRDI